MDKLTQLMLTMDKRPVAIQGERNMLKLVRKADIDLPTFCYHSATSQRSRTVHEMRRLCEGLQSTRSRGGIDEWTSLRS